MAQKKILLVDDSNTVLMMEQSILDGQPYVLLIAKNGEDGVAQAKKELPDLILMDVVMPKLDGLAARAQLAADEATRGIPILMVTTQGELANVEKKLGAGTFEFVTKPFDPEALLAKVKALLA